MTEHPHDTEERARRAAAQISVILRTLPPADRRRIMETMNARLVARGEPPAFDEESIRIAEVAPLASEALREALHQSIEADRAAGRPLPQLEDYE